MSSNEDTWIGLIYTTHELKQFRITCYVIFVHTILNSGSYSRSGREVIQTVWSFQNNISWHAKAYTNFQDDLTFNLENPKIRVFLNF